jgi:ABC-type multidrug transport system fused ATPase/permease subunit
MVLEKGKIKEMDSPMNLVANRKSDFFSMAKEAGIV